MVFVSITAPFLLLGKRGKPTIAVPQINALEAQGWKVVQMLTLTHAVGKGPVQDQGLIFRLEK